MKASVMARRFGIVVGVFSVSAIGSLKAYAQAGDGLTGTYYNWPAAVTVGAPPPPPGSPEGPQPPVDTWTVTATHVDPTVDFVDGAGANWVPGGVGPNNFTVVWTGAILTGADTGTYTFHISTDDGSRLWVNNIPVAGAGGGEVINSWINQGPTNYTGTVTLNANTIYPIRYEFYQQGGGTSATLGWSSATMPQAIIPQTNLYSTVPMPPAPPTNVMGTALAFPQGLYGQIQVTWTASTGATSYTIYSGPSATGPFTQVGTSNTTSFLDTTSVQGQTYFYVVTATNIAGTSAQSAASPSVTALVAPPQTPKRSKTCSCSTVEGIPSRTLFWTSLLALAVLAVRRRT
jgi:MYXO-CTERM domain-containing protein